MSWIQDPDDPFRVGTMVRLSSSGRRARVIEYRGNLGPKGAKVYRLMLRRRPLSITEVLAEQIEPWRPEGLAAPDVDAATPPARPEFGAAPGDGSRA